MKRIFGNFVVVLLVALFVTIVLAGRLLAQQGKEPSLGLYSAWINTLLPEYRVVRGRAFLMTNSECPTFISIFNSCFGNNAPPTLFRSRPSRIPTLILIMLRP